MLFEVWDIEEIKGEKRVKSSWLDKKNFNVY